MRRTIVRLSKSLHLLLAATGPLAAAPAQTTSLAPSNPGGLTLPAAPVVVQPGSYSGPLQATGCETDATNLCLLCSASCDLPTNDLFAGIAGCIPFQTRFAQASLFTDFQVGSTAQTYGNLVPVSVDYSVGWFGTWGLLGVFGSGLASASADITLYLEDATAASPVIVKTEKIHHEEPNDQISIEIVSAGAWVDTDDVQSSFTSLLVRGHTYRIRLTLRVEVIYVLCGTAYEVSYFPAGFQSLSVTVGEDPKGLLPGVAAKSVDDFIALTGGNVADCLATHTITTPNPGWVHVTATCQANAFHQNGTVTQANFGVTDDVEILPSNQDLAFSISSGYPSGTLVAPVTAQAVFPVAAAGDHTFYFMGTSTSGGMSVHDIQLTLCYLPEAYGTIGLPIQVSSGAPTFEQEYGGIARPPLGPAEIAAQRESDVQGYTRYLEERVRKLEQLLAEQRAPRAAAPGPR